MIKTLGHVCLFCEDLDRTSDFYCGILGLHKKFDLVREGKTIGFYLQIDRSHFLEVFKAGGGLCEEPSTKRIAHFCFEVADIDRARETLAAKGIPVSEKTKGSTHSWQIWCKDPDGTDIELQQYTPESLQIAP